MAYITKEQVAEKRKKLNTLFPEFKFSVRHIDAVKISVAIMEGPYRMQHDGYGRSWKYSFELTERNRAFFEVLSQIMKVIQEGNYDSSRPEIDYFEVGFYSDLLIGKEDVPYTVNPKRSKLVPEERKHLLEV